MNWTSPTALSASLSPQDLRRHLDGLLLYQQVLETPVLKAFLDLLELLSTDGDAPAIQQAYGIWFRQLAIAQQRWPDIILATVLLDDNPFSRQVQHHPLAQLPLALVQAAQADLHCLEQLYHCTCLRICQWVQQAARLETAPIPWDVTHATFDPAFFGDWAHNLEAFATHYRQQGTGLFGRYRALRWVQGELLGIEHPDPVQLDDLVGYEDQKRSLLQNTERLLQGLPALNVLLYGSRGAGKSSLVKAQLNTYSDRGLRLIEVAKAELLHLPAIVEQLRAVPQTFILFVDDLSFEEDDDAFKALKVVLEGGAIARPANVVVYATSNRRHLIREFHDERPRPRDADEVHQWDTVQEKLSFSDRFGLTLTFEPANQETFLAIVRHLVQQANVEIAPADLDFRARQWATRHNGRSGRTAQQFVDWLRGEDTQAPRNSGES